MYAGSWGSAPNPGAASDYATGWRCPFGAALVNDAVSEIKSEIKFSPWFSFFSLLSVADLSDYIVSCSCRLEETRGTLVFQNLWWLVSFDNNYQKLISNIRKGRIKHASRNNPNNSHNYSNDFRNVYIISYFELVKRKPWIAHQLSLKTESLIIYGILNYSTDEYTFPPGTRLKSKSLFTWVWPTSVA